ncbi:MAG: LL-diaminopimelate aminotransferase [Bacteroidaceae bacterium]|nr:LL-diaminopimelate aminotransferase [Bacteroidaceae bacterium]
MINKHYLQLADNYLFADIAHLVQAYKATHAKADVISLGIGDVTQPLVPAVVDALTAAAKEMGAEATFRGYGPERGYTFLREAIVAHDYRRHGIGITADEVFVSDGSKSDTGNFQELLSASCVVAVTDPVYPVYVDSNVMAGRRVVKLPCVAANGFSPAMPDEDVDVIYLCYPNNPTGCVLSRSELHAWVDYALAHEALILYDAAYEAFIQSSDIPHSIYEIPGAERCAVEFRSFSKTAGFTGLRCGYTVVPKALKVRNGRSRHKALSMNSLWLRRQCTKFNGCSYLSQRAAEATYSPEGRAQVRQRIAYYMDNARLIRETLTALGYEVHGGVDAPYLWVRTPGGMASWTFFDLLLHKARVVCTPGAGFGSCGEGYVRLTAFGRREQTMEALERIKGISI